VVGGSFSVAWEVGQQRYSDRLQQVLQDNWKGKSIKVINRSIGGTSAGFLLLCLSNLLEDDPDVVILEITPNLAHTYVPLNSESYHVVERLLRRILSWRSSPALILMHLTLPPRFGNFVNMFYNTQEDGVNTLSQYYGVPIISMRNCLYHLERANLTGFTTEELRVLDSSGKGYFHYSALGHLYITQVLFRLFRSAFARASASATRSRTVCTQPVHNRLMLPGNIDGNYLSCSSGFTLQSLAVNNSGWRYMADDKRQVKYGLISMDAGQRVSLRVMHKGWLAVFVAYLTSYDNMGQASFSCIMDCTCNPILVNATIAERVSVTDIAVLDVQAHGECHIQVTSYGSQGRKFKVIGIMEAQGEPLLFKGWFKRAGLVR
jgi:lysophospholipase L1-like esterase